MANFEKGLLKAYEVFRLLDSALNGAPYDGKVPTAVNGVPKSYWEAMEVEKTVLKDAVSVVEKALEKDNSQGLQEYADRIGRLFSSQKAACDAVLGWLGANSPK